MTCIVNGDYVDAGLNRLLTQYRESEKLKSVITAYLSQVEDVSLSICDLPSSFDIDSAIGDQLTILGRQLGWPRCHCICASMPVFGFKCPDTTLTIAGFCEPNSTWVDCNDFGAGTICINDDDIYRGFLQARRYQVLNLFDAASIASALKYLFGQAADILSYGNRSIIVSPGRELTQQEITILQLYPRVIPAPLGVEIKFTFNTAHIFGFGAGWGGFCELVHPNATATSDAEWLCEYEVEAYNC